MYIRQNFSQFHRTLERGGKYLLRIDRRKQMVSY